MTKKIQVPVKACLDDSDDHVQINIRLREDEKEAWRTYAEAQGLKLSELIRGSVRVVVKAEYRFGEH